MVTLYRPALVLIVDDLPADSVPMVLSWIRSEGSHSRTIVLTEDGERRRRALASGADAALLKGFLAPRLFQVIESLAHTSHSPGGSRLAFPEQFAPIDEAASSETG
jgi:DNA-binding NarL/FixJ family response regulator